MADNEIQYTVTVNDQGVITSLNKIENEANKSSKKINSNFSDTAKNIRGAFSAVAATIASVAVGFTLKKAIDEAVGSEKAIRQLNASLALNGNYTKLSSIGFQNFAQDLSKVTGVSDDLIIQNAATLASVNKLSTDGLKKASVSALDLAAALQIDVGSAFDLISKASNGNVGSLSRYGIKLDETRAKTEGVSYVSEILNQKFGGLSKTMENTFTGASAKVSLGIDEIFKSIGNAIIKSPAVIAVIKTIGETFFKLSESIDNASKGGFVDNLVIKILEVSKILNDGLIKPFEYLFNFIKTGGLGILTIFSGIGTIIIKIGGLIFNYLIKPIADFFTTVSTKIVGLFDKDLANSLRIALNGLTKEFSYMLDGADMFASDLTETLFNKTSESADQAFNVNVSNSVDGFLTNLQRAVDGSKVAGDDIKNNTDKIAEDVSSSFQKAYDSINKIYQDGIIGLISASMQRLGASLIKGGDAFSDFRNVVLGIIGDVAINIGTTLVGIGISIDSLKASLLTLTGGTAIAAGLALIAIGGALKSLGGGLGSTATPGGIAPTTGGGITSSPESAITTEPAREREKQQSTVTINIQGSVMDSDETGLRIVDLIGKAFDQQGAVIRGMA